MARPIEGIAPEQFDPAFHALRELMEYRSGRTVGVGGLLDSMERGKLRPEDIGSNLAEFRVIVALEAEQMMDDRPDIPESDWGLYDAANVALNERRAAWLDSLENDQPQSEAA